MLIQLSQDFGAYFYDVFVARFDFWLVFGIVAQVLFGARFIVQWIASERAGKSVMPLAFWFFSMAGGLMTLVYGLVRREPVIIFGQTLAIVIYLRNLMLIFRERQSGSSSRAVGIASRSNAPPTAVQAAFAASRRQSREPGIEIGLEIVEVLQPDMEAKGRARRIASASRCGRRRSRRGSTRLSKPPQEEPMPNSSSPSSMAARAAFGAGFEHDREQPGGALEVALPDRVAGIALERRVEHARDLRARLEPARHVERLTLVLLEAQRHGPQAAQGKEDVLRSGAHGEAVEGAPQRRPGACVRRDEPEQQVRVARQVFGAGLDREIDAALVRREQQRRRPGVVHERRRRRAGAPPRRWPGCPASRRIASPGPR